MSELGDGKVVVEQTEETKLHCVIKSSFEEEEEGVSGIYLSLAGPLWTHSEVINAFWSF